MINSQKRPVKKALVPGEKAPMYSTEEGTFEPFVVKKSAVPFNRLTAFV
jgi:hypothetical protein